MTLEDVPGLVVEAGSAWTRLGVAGDVAPQLIVSSAYAKDSASGDVPLYGDDINSHTPTKEVYSPVIDSVIHDWEAATGLWKHLATSIGYDLSDQPLSLVEPLHNPQANRVKALSVAFEDVEVPLFTLVKAPLAAAFASARTTALVVSVGAASSWVAPIIDGAINTKAVLNTRFAGDFVSAHVVSHFASRNITPVPSYQVRARAGNLEPGEPAPAGLHPEGTASYHSYQVTRLVDQFKQVVVQAAPAPSALQGNGGVRPFEFPTGYNLLFGEERFAMAEPLFKPARVQLPGIPVPDYSLGISELVYQSLNKIEVSPEIVGSLLSNIVLCGGGSQLAGVARRIESDLVQMLPNYTPTFHLPSKPTDRTNLVWTGASILASLGTYDRTWVTREEYLEVGAEQLVEKRFT